MTDYDTIGEIRRFTKAADGIGFVEHERARARGMPINNYMMWRRELREDYERTFPRSTRTPRTRLPAILADLAARRREFRRLADLAAKRSW